MSSSTRDAEDEHEAHIEHADACPSVIAGDDFIAAAESRARHAAERGPFFGAATGDGTEGTDAADPQL